MTSVRAQYEAQYSLYERYLHLREALAEHECEGCGGPAQHVDPDGATFCLECVAASEEDGE